MKLWQLFYNCSQTTQKGQTEKAKVENAQTVLTTFV
jgi:hypothetical protein